MGINRKVVFATVAAAIGGLFFSAGAWAQKETLRVADYLPANYDFARNGTKYWMERVTTRTNGAVALEYYPSEQLGKAKDILSLTLSGVVDIGLVAPSYVSDKMPLSAAAELPGGFSTACQGTLAYWKLATTGILAKEDFAPNRIRLLLSLVNPPYQILVSRTKLEGVKSFDGLKLRSTGGAMDVMVRKLSAVPVRMAGPEVFEGLSRGTLDGLVFPLQAVLSYDLQGLVRQSTLGQNFGSAILNYVISEDRWQRLSPEIRKALAEEGEAATRRNCGIIDETQAGAIERLKSAGVSMVTLPPEASREIETMLSSVAAEWAGGLDKRGRPATQVLKEFREAVVH